MEVIEAIDRPAYRSFYTVAGRLLFLECFDLRFGRLIERLFTGWQLTPVVSAESSPDIHVEFYCALPVIPANLNCFEIAEGGKCFTDGVDLYVLLRNCLVRLRSSSPISVTVSFAELPGPADPVPARAISFAVCAALRRSGVFDLHGAGVIHPQSDRGVLIVGPSGSGKSTLALRLAMDGWPYLSDDEVLLSFTGGEVEARGFRSFFAVNGDTATAHGIQTTDESYKTCFEPEAVVSTSRRLLAIPAVLLFIRLSGQTKSQLNKLTQAEAMARLIRACPWASYDAAIADANLEVLSKLARQTSAFDLHAGRDLLEPGHASGLLSTL